MAASSDDLRVVVPFMPSLLHCASVKIAVQLFNEFGVEILEEVFSEIQLGNSTTSEESIEQNCKANRAKACLLFIPAHLRGRVMKAVHGLHYALGKWQLYHSDLVKFTSGAFNLYWRSDGSVDSVKTAEQLALNEKLTIRKRFEIACLYCLKESVKTLWAEMEASGQTESFGMQDECMVRFWVRWLREGSRVPWTQAAGEYLYPYIMESVRSIAIIPQIGNCLGAVIPRFSAFLPFLRLENKQKYLDLLNLCPSFDDLRLYLYTITKEEEEQILKRIPRMLLLLHLEWPLQNLFIKTAERMCNYIDCNCFRNLCLHFLNVKFEMKDFDYSELFEGLWNSSPIHLRECVREWPVLRQRIDSYFNEKRRKRKSDDHEEIKKFS